MTEQTTYSYSTPDLPEGSPPREEQVEQLRRGVSDPRPNAGDFEHSPGRWVQTADGWVDPAELPSNGHVKDVNGRWVSVADLRRQVAEAGDGGLQGKELNEHYAGEDESSAWRNPRNPQSTRVTTAYAEGEEQAGMATDTAGGLVLGSDGAPVTGSYGWVMDPDDGTLYLFPEDYARFLIDSTGEQKVLPLAQALTALRSGQTQNIAAYHHSTPLAGAPVAGAGLMTLDGGRITSVNDVSGHYRDEAEFVHQSLASLEGQGMDLSDTTVDLSGAVLPGGRPGKQWLAENPDLPQEAVSLNWQQFEQTQGNEPQIRRKINVNEEINNAEFAGEGSLQQRMHASAEDSAIEGYGDVQSGSPVGHASEDGDPLREGTHGLTYLTPSYEEGGTNYASENYHLQSSPVYHTPEEEEEEE